MKRAQGIGALVGLVLLSVVLFHTLHHGTIAQAVWLPAWPWLLASLIFHLINLHIGALGWTSLLQYAGSSSETLQDHRTNYWVSLPFQSLGGTWGPALSRWWLSRGKEFSHRRLFTLLLTEKASIALSSLIMIGFLELLEPPFPLALLVIFIGLGVGIGVRSWIVLHRVSQEKRTPKLWDLTVLYLVPFQIMNVLGICCLLRASGIQHGMENLQLTRAYYLSWWLGQLVVIIPQGLGVREALFTYFTHNAMSGAWSAVFSLWARLVGLLSQALPLLGVWRSKRSVKSSVPG